MNHRSAWVMDPTEDASDADRPVRGAALSRRHRDKLPALDVGHYNDYYKFPTYLTHMGGMPLRGRRGPSPPVPGRPEHSTPFPLGAFDPPLFPPPPPAQAVEIRSPPSPPPPAGSRSRSSSATGDTVSRSSTPPTPPAAPKEPARARSASPSPAAPHRHRHERHSAQCQARRARHAKAAREKTGVALECNHDHDHLGLGKVHKASCPRFEMKGPTFEPFPAWMHKAKKYAYHEPDFDDIDFEESFAPGFIHEEPFVEIEAFTTPTAYIVHAYLAGAEKNDLQVRFDAAESVVTIAGFLHRPAEVDVKMLNNAIQTERVSGWFTRRVRLLDFLGMAKVDTDEITAKLENGVLRIELPKTAEEEWTDTKKVVIK